MRIGILTFHRTNNVGAVLQSAALVNFINSSIGDCEIIDFVPNNCLPLKTPSPIKKIVKLIFNFIRFGFKKTRERKFDDFRNTFYKISNQTYYGDADIEKSPPKYDFIISGSDQVLNTTLTGNSQSFYLAFSEETPKISYASSFGRENITDAEKSLIKKELPKFNSISCREKSGIELIKNEINISPTLVADPTFLIDCSEWDKMSNNLKLPRKYIFVYAMEYSPQIDAILKTARKEFDLPVYIMCGGKTAQKLHGKKCISWGPGEFLYAIKNADVVITNSFHGTAFSIIFQKKFICVSHSTRNTRLENIMEITCNKSKLIDYKTNIDYVKDYLIDGKECQELLKPVIEDSKFFLYNSLK